MNQATIILSLGTVEILDGGKIIPSKKGAKISLDAKIKTASNAKVEIDVNGQVYAIHNDQNVTIKDIIKLGGDNSGTTQAAGVRG